jgi:PAS domain S-box-containing protein
MYKGSKIIKDKHLSGDKKLRNEIVRKVEEKLPFAPVTSQEILDSEAKYRTLFESANDAIIILDRYLIVDCNQNSADMMRCKREDIIGKMAFDFWPEVQPDGRNSQEAGLEIVKSALAGGKCPFEWQHKRADGTLIDTYGTLNVLQWKGEKYLQSIIRDYSENKKARDRMEEINKCWLGFGANPFNNIESLVALCGKELKADCALYNRIDSGMLHTVAGWNAPADLPKESKAEGHVCNDVVAGGRNDVLVVRNLPASKYARTDSNVTAFGLKTYIGKTVSIEKRNIGTICVVFRRDIEPGENDLKLLGIIAAAIGIEEVRRQVMAELSESEERFRLLVANSPDFILSLDRERRVAAVNENISRKYGYNPVDFIGHKFYDFIHNDDRDLIRQYFQAMLDLKKESTQGLQFRLVDPKKEKWWDFEFNINIQYDEGGNYLHAFGIGRDITQRKQTEEALRLTQVSVENSSDAVIWVNPEGRITSVNKEACRALGYTREELLSMFAYALDPASSESSWSAEWQSLKNNDKRNFESRHRRKDGSTFPVEVTWKYIEINGKEFSFASIRDISERKRLEKQLRQAQKMEAIGTLAGGIAHDFNNLLMGVQGNASLMLLTTPPADPNQEKLLSIQQYVQKGSELTRQLLGFASGGKYYIRPTEIKELVKQSAELFGRTKKEISLSFNYQDMPCIAEVDRVQIEQVLLNIFVNASQAMPGGGNILISVGHILLDDDFVRSMNIKSGNYIKVTIRDTGIGMDQATMARIFEPFFTTKEMRHGIGLGLASAYGIIKNHKGAIDVESEKGNGTSFTIYLPASGKPLAEEKAVDENIIKGMETILLVDDEEAIIEVTQAILETLGYKVRSAKSGQEAIAIYSSEKDTIDLVIMDMIMPQMGGSECFDALKKINPAIKVILSSGYSITDQAQMIMQKGCSNFIQKPFSINKLSQKVRETLDRKYS